MRIRLAILIIAATISANAPCELSARPLRIWVMNNEAAISSPQVTEAEIRAAIEKWKSQGIIIENTASNLLIPAETKYPLASHILGDNNFLRQIADYRKKAGDAEPISIEFIRWDDAYNRITSALTSDDIETTPDIAQVGHSWAVGLANQGRIADVSAEIDGSAFYPPQMVGSKAFEKEGLYAVPWFSEMRLLYYNKTLVPSADALAHWDSFLSTCEAYTKKTDKPFIGFATTISWNLLHNMAPWIWAGGGDIVNASKIGPLTMPKVALDSEESLHGMLYLKKLSESGCAAFPNTSQEMADRMFLGGEFAVLITGPWITRFMGPAWRDRFGATSLPAGPAGSQPFVGGSHLVISEASKARGNFERAQDFVQFLTSPGAQETFNRMSGFYPVNKEALESFLASDTEGLLKKAVERGLSYPAMGDWGEIVENEFIRSHLWHIWRDIAQGVPDETLIATVENAAGSLRTKLYISQAKRAAPYAALAIAALLAASAAMTALSRRRLSIASRLCDEKSAELTCICAERTVLQGKALFLERRGAEQSEELGNLKEKLAALGERAQALKAELVKCSPKKAGDEKNIGSFSIGWEGSLAIRGEGVRFENNRQARRLMEQMVRGTSSGRPSLHCLWGYALFGWRPAELQSHPQRLFEIMAAKINAQLKSHGAPALVIKAGKGSFSWKIGWDQRLVLGNSDMKRSDAESMLASKAAAEGSTEQACAHAITALELDPKNLEALALIRDALSSSKTVQPYRARMGSMLKISEGIIAREINALREGIKAVVSIASSGRLPRGMEREEIDEELAAMKYAEDYLAGRFASLFMPAAAGERRPAVLNDIMQRISAIHRDIASLKARGASDETLWAQVAGSQSFSQLMAVPHISSMVGNFYNDEIEENEDPRLVQLALISMISSEDSLGKLGGAKDEHDMISAMRKGLVREINSLSDTLGSMPSD